MDKKEKENKDDPKDKSLNISGTLDDVLKVSVPTKPKDEK